MRNHRRWSGSGLSLEPAIGASQKRFAANGLVPAARQIAIVVCLGLFAGCSGTSTPQAATSPIRLSQNSPQVIENDSAETLALVNAAERLANNTCACTNSECADSATNGFVEWLQTHPEREGSAVAAKRVLVALEKMLFCRDRLAYPSDPIDLEASSS